jgi:hypothetical protein
MKHIIIIAVLFSFVGCSQNDKKQKPFKATAKEKEIDSLNTRQIASLNRRNNVMEGWDTLDYTYQAQSLFSISKSNISLNGEVADIVKINNDYILKVGSLNAPAFNCTVIADLKIDSTKIPSLIEKMKSAGYGTNYGYFIFKPSFTKVLYPQISSENNSDEKDPELSVNTERFIFYLKGDLLDYYIPLNDKRK